MVLSENQITEVAERPKMILLYIEEEDKENKALQENVFNREEQNHLTKG